MDKKTADRLLAVLDAEIALLQRGREEILQLVNGSTLRHAEGPLARVGEPVKKVYQALLNAGRKMSPKELFDLLVKSGAEIDQSRMRQILHQHKDKLFESPKRGVWRAKVLN